MGRRGNLPAQCLFLLSKSMNGTRRLPRRFAPRNDISFSFLLSLSHPVFQVTGTDNWGLGVYGFPGLGFLFVLFHDISPHTIVYTPLWI